jgi:hypothetical protein
VPWSSRSPARRGLSRKSQSTNLSKVKSSSKFTPAVSVTQTPSSSRAHLATALPFRAFPAMKSLAA